MFDFAALIRQHRSMRPLPSPALAGRRQQRILVELADHGDVRVRELTALLGVSEMTIRRDLDVLADRGLLVKVHGGATRVDVRRSTDEPGFAAKSHRQQREKEAIADSAASLIRPGTAIGITAGTTTWQLARRMADVADLVVVTNSLPVADALHERRRGDLTVVLTGGVRTPSDALVGPVAAATLRSLHLDVVFMGVHGMADDAGFTTPNLIEADTNRAFVASAQRLVVLADHTKWGLVGLSSMAALEDADVVVTDDHITAAARAALVASVGDLVVVRRLRAERRA